MTSLDEFRRELTSAGDEEHDLEFRRSVFVERICEILTNGEIVEGASPCTWEGTHARKKIAVSAGSFQPADGSLVLILAHLDGTKGEPPVLAPGVVERLRRMLTGFLTAAMAGGLEGKLDQDLAVADVISTLSERRTEISRARLLLVTDAKVSNRLRDMPTDKVGDLACEFQVWDVERLAELTGRGHEAIEIDLREEFDTCIPCLPAHLSAENYQSYLCVVPGDLLADLYGRYGARLLETNVRGFLSDRGKVNRGLRATLQNRPHMFFAYNNGVTATATGVTLDAEGNNITRIDDLQIVNGGQTTASLYWAKRKHKTSLDRVFVQMKLSVIQGGTSVDFDQVVADISRFANSQNKVSEADLFANHPFHREMERISRRCGLPALDGGQYQTYWFYERARAQYQNERATCSTATQRSIFDKKFPKKQLITKTDLAKYVNILDQLPHVVSAGAQKSFKRFAEVAATRWERNRDQYNEVFFKRSVGVALLYRALEAQVPRQTAWYRGHRAAIVPYTLALLTHLVELDGKCLNLLSLWTAQRVPSEVESALVDMARQVWAGLSEHPDRANRAQWGNLGEWFKVEQCWSACRNLGVSLPAGLFSIMITETQYASQDAAGQQSQRISTEVDAREEALRLREQGYWQRLKDWNQVEPVLTDGQYETVCRLLSEESRRPTDAECRVLMLAKQRAEDNGFIGADSSPVTVA